MQFEILAYYVCRDVLARLTEAAGEGRTSVANAWNMVDWTPEAIASFESSTSTGPLIDLCIPSDGRVNINCESSCMRKGTTWPCTIILELWTLSVIHIDL